MNTITGGVTYSRLHRFISLWHHTRTRTHTCTRLNTCPGYRLRWKLHFDGFLSSLHICDKYGCIFQNVSTAGLCASVFVCVCMRPTLLSSPWVVFSPCQDIVGYKIRHLFCPTEKGVNTCVLVCVVTFVASQITRWNQCCFHTADLCWLSLLHNETAVVHTKRFTFSSSVAVIHW